ncbi:MAG: hypothetical protein AABZ23_01415 [Deltaproteobacteria bacterium]
MCDIENITTLYKTRADKELLLKFFLTFARFEFALKGTGWFIRTRPKKTPKHPVIKTARKAAPQKYPDAKPDWAKFAQSLQNVFSIDKNQTIEDACEYIFENPPMKQVIIPTGDDNHEIAWENAKVSYESTSVKFYQNSVEFYLNMVRRVRNNLFHGGKHNIGLHEDTQRTEKLLRSSLVILKECLVLAPDDVKNAFKEAVI